MPGRGKPGGLLGEVEAEAGSALVWTFESQRPGPRTYVVLECEGSYRDKGKGGAFLPAMMMMRGPSATVPRLPSPRLEGEGGPTSHCAALPQTLTHESRMGQKSGGTSGVLGGKDRRFGEKRGRVEAIDQFFEWKRKSLGTEQLFPQASMPNGTGVTRRGGLARVLAPGSLGTPSMGSCTGVELLSEFNGPPWLTAAGQ
jgi:hypothetical protein